MDRILTVREPFASALVTGLKKAEYRPYRIPAGTKVWIHSGLQPGIRMDKELTTWIREQGDPIAADYIEWMYSEDPGPRPLVEQSALASMIYQSTGTPKGRIFPFGKIIGYCVFGESTKAEGEERRLGAWANHVQESRLLDPKDWRIHKGSLGLMPYGGVQ